MNNRFKFRAWDPVRKIMIRDISIIIKSDVMMQCTGLRDVNAALLYECDLVKFTTGTICNLHKIIWNTPDKGGYAAWALEDIKTKEVKYLGNGSHCLHVQGNIYEHAELMK